MKHPNLLQSFIHAFRGLSYAVRGERNMAIHLVIASGVLMLSVLFHLETIEFFIILICIALVLVAETINTAFEYMVDLFHGHRIDPIVKMLKDVASAAVLLASLFSALIGSWIFLEKILSESR